MWPDIAVRAATVEDADEMSFVVILSIVRICMLDHQDDSRVIDGWVVNKTPTSFINWIVDEALYLNVATSEGRIVGVGMCNNHSQILLCYVHPDFIGHGVGGEIVFNLEAEIERAGGSEVSLVSTRTAFGFYQKKGYVRSSDNIRVKGLLGIPMVKKKH